MIEGAGFYLISMNTRIYLDYNATTPLEPRVKEILISHLDSFANASSMHEDGRSVAKEIFTAREYVAALINAEGGDILFTSGGSESNNAVFNTMISPSLTRSTHLKELYGNRKTILISAIEHPCVMESAKKLEKLGFIVNLIPVDSNGLLDIDSYKNLLLSSKPLLVSIMMANNEIGTIQNIKELALLAHNEGALFHTDAVQAVGKIPVDVKDLNIDYLTLSAHKLYGPKGVGALYVKKGAPIEAFIKGGHQEKGLRAGTYNSPSIIAFGEAARIAREGLQFYETHTRRLRNKLRDGFLSVIPDIRINGHPEHVLPNTLDVSFPGAEGEAILLMLDILGVSVSTGSACASGSLEPSHVLMATGVGPELAHGSIRFSLGMYTTDEQIDFVLKEMPPLIKRLRGFSTLSHEAL